MDYVVCVFPELPTERRRGRTVGGWVGGWVTIPVTTPMRSEEQREARESRFLVVSTLIPKGPRDGQHLVTSASANLVLSRSQRETLNHS